MHNSPAGEEKAEEREHDAPVPRIRSHRRADLTTAMPKALRVRNALLRECMAELLGTFVLLVSEVVLFQQHTLSYHVWILQRKRK